MPTNITLREAAKLRSKIELRLQEIQGEMTLQIVSVNLFDPDPLKDVNEAPAKVQTLWAQFTSLAGVLVNLRRGIDDGNHSREAGQPSVSDLLAEIASLHRQAGAIRYLGAANPRLTDEQLKARLEGHRDMLGAGEVPPQDEPGIRPRRRRALPAYGAADELRVDTFPQELIDAFKAADKSFNNLAEKLHNRVEKLNNSLTLSVEDGATAVLAANGIEV